MHSVLFYFHTITIYTYGFFVALAVLVSYFAAGRRARTMGFDPRFAGDLVFFLFVSGVIGARFFYVFQHFEDYKGNLWKAAAIAEGGLVWYGGFLTAASLGLGLAAWKSWPILKLCDLLAPIVPLGHAIGRLGCFFNGCCYGKQTPPSLGLRFPADNTPRFPVQIFEAVHLFSLSIFIFYFPSKKLKPGQLFLLYLIFYSVMRFFTEFLRGDQSLLWFLTPPQWTSLLLFLGASPLYFFIRKKPGF